MHPWSFSKCFTLCGKPQQTFMRALSNMNPISGKNFYKTLELEKNCSDKEVREAYIRLSKEHHPDKNPNSVKSDTKFIDIHEAYTVLSKPATRRRYDDYLCNNDMDQPFTSPYEELTYRYNQYNKYRNDAKNRKTNNDTPLHKVLFLVVGAMFFVGIVEFQIVKKFVQRPDEVIDGIPIFHSDLMGPDLSKMNDEQVEAYQSSRRRIIVNTVKSMKAEAESRIRDQERLKTMLENSSHRPKSEN